MTTTQIQEKTASKSLKFKTSKVHGENNIFVSIGLDDECKNGHQDFSITADIYKAGKPKIDRYCIMGGCCHDEILKAFPEFKIFVNLHLCDWEGIPTYAVENGYYHLTNGFNNTKPESSKFKSEFCEYYRINSTQFDVLITSKNQLQYALNIQSSGILTQWKEEAKKAIELLEQMTGKEFLIDSVKTQFHAPTPEQIKEEEEKQKNGYYTSVAEQKRELAKQDALIAKLKDQFDKEISKAKIEFQVKKQVLIHGGEKAFNNCIFYNHTQELTFNWRGYDMISSELVDKIKSSAKLPKGVTIKDDKGR